MIEPAARENVTHQAGGGASAAQRAVETIHAVTLPYLKQIYAHHAGDKAVWSKEQAQFFLQTVQKHPVTEAVGSVLAKDTLDFNGFLTYISSSHASVTLEPKKEDLSWPLSAYFISSSHNTYLSGNQLSSDSTTASYTNVLLRGCRCVEIDVWDGDEDSDSDSSDDEGGDQALASKKSKRSSTFGKLKSSLPDSLAARLKKTNLGKKAEEKDAKEGGVAPAPATEKPPVHEKTPEVAVVEPRVLHGYTLTKEISFRDVCVAIRDNGFAVTDTPIIVSLEVHCKPPQQMLMVKIMKEIWSEHLVPEPDHDPVSLPSPGELRNKILVKVKYAPPGSSPPVEDSEDDDRLSGEVSRKGESKKEKPSKITQELSRLGVFTKGISFKSLAQPEASMPTHIFSLSEKKFLDYHEKQREGLFKHNRDYLVRAYPSGLRIRSSNLNPPIFWGAGAQVVALNWQQTDEGMMLNEGMFAGTGGYVLKPPGYRPILSSKPETEVVSRQKLNLSITFLAAQDLPLPLGDTRAAGFEPYVKVELHVDGSKAQQLGEHPEDKTDGHEREGEYKERTRTHRGCNVDMGGEKLEFKDIPNLMEELTFVRFTVRDDETLKRDDLAAWACVRLDRLGNGYRFLHLIDLTGKLTKGAILVKIEKTLG